MPSQDSSTRKTVNTLVRGLITESTDLTFPVDATVDELNCDLRLNGERRRRKGLALEDGGVFHSVGATTGSLFRVQIWERVGDTIDLEFCVVQTGSQISFFERQRGSVSNYPKSFNIDLNDYAVGNNNPEDFPIATSNILGWLVITSGACETLIVKYAEDTDTISVEVVPFNIRDFKRKVTSNTFDEQPLALSKEHEYDLKNMGWDTAKIEEFFASEASYPPRNTFWWSGKNSDGDFSVEDYLKVYSGNSFAGNGHFILDLFSQDFTGASSVEGFAKTLISNRFSESVVFAGRVFFCGLSSSNNSSKVYFSNTVVGSEDIGLLYQRGDPTSEAEPDIIDSDGGEINIGEADTIIKLFSYGSSLIVFATNGIWEIKGPDGFFTASSYIIDKISDLGTESKESITDMEGSPFWWSKTGIHTLVRDNVTGRPQLQNLSQPTIQTFFEEIPNSVRSLCRGVFDKTDRIIYWFYPDVSSGLSNLFNNVLLLNVNLGSFYPWRIESADSKHIVGGFYNFPESSQRVDSSVVSGVLNVLVGVDNVTATSSSRIAATAEESQLKVMVFSETLGVSFAEFKDRGFSDWGVPYSSYFETGYDFQDNLWQDKQCDGVVCYYTLTEDGVSDDGEGNLKLDNPSSCFMQVKWDGATSASTYKWSREYQTYRLTRVVLPDTAGSVDFGFSKVKTLTRVRGRGDSIRMRFRSEDGKDFRFQGYEAIVGKPRTFI